MVKLLGVILRSIATKDITHERGGKDSRPLRSRLAAQKDRRTAGAQHRLLAGRFALELVLG